jgi:hypothetical protein
MHIQSPYHLHKIQAKYNQPIALWIELHQTLQVG